MTNMSERNKILLGLVLVALIGIVASKIKAVVLVWGLLLFAYTTYLTIKNKNENGEAHLIVAYIIGAEVFFRMSFAGLPYEFGKYAIIFLLSLGMIVDRHQRSFPFLIVLYMLLMLPTIPLTIEFYPDADAIKGKLFFNLLGPLSLMVSTLYFYQLRLTNKEFINISRAIAYGVFTMALLVLFKVGDYASLEFTYSSNADASGGFSGNQVSSAFGIGVAIIGINLVLKNRLFHYLLIDIGLLLLFIFQGLMTFSRGGMLTGLLAVFMGAIFFYFSNFSQLVSFLRHNFFKLIIAGGIAVGAFIVTDNVTGGYLSVRYFNVDERGFQQKEDLTTGRGDILKGDIALFFDSDLVGVGPGVSMWVRKTHNGFAAHVEYSRMLADHGILGLIGIFILLGLPLVQFFKLLPRPTNQMVFVSFMVMALPTMAHAAMRLGMVGFFYGLAFIIIVDQAQSKENIQ